MNFSMPALAVSAGMLLIAFSGFLVQVLFARNLSVVEFGLLMSILNTYTMMIPIAVFGLTAYWFRFFGEFGWSALVAIRPSFRLLIYTVSLVLMVTIAFLLFTKEKSNYIYVLVLGSVLVAGVFTEISSAIYQLEGRFYRFTFVQKLPFLLRIGFVYFMFRYSENMGLSKSGAAVAAIVISSLIVVFASVPNLKRFKSCRIVLAGHKKNKFEEIIPKASCKSLIKGSWVYGVVGMLYLAWGQAHVIVASLMLGDEAAGVYAACLLVVNALCLLPSSLYSKYFLPQIHRWAHSDLKKLKAVYRSGNRILLFIGLLLLFALYLGAEFVVPGLFSEKYYAAVPLLEVICLTLPVRFLGYSVGALLVTDKHMMIKFKILCAVVGMNFLFVMIFSQRYGLLAFAWSIVVSEYILVALYYFKVKEIYFSNAVAR